METLQSLQETCSSAQVIAASTLGKPLLTMKWVEHLLRGGRISSLEVLKSPHGTQQPALNGPALNRIKPDDLQRSLPKQILLGFCGMLFINQSFLSGHKVREQQKV